MKNILLLLLSLSLFVSGVFSQTPDSGYVITNKGDTIWGRFKQDILSKKVKIYIDGKLKKFEVSELQGYKMGDEINKRFSNDLFMATLEVPGRISYYAIHVNGEYGFDQYFLEKDGNSCAITKKTLKTIIPGWLQDYSCDSLLLKEELNFKRLKEIIKEYNRCDEAKSSTGKSQ